MLVILFERKPGSPWSWLITKVTRSRWSHAGLSLGQGIVLDASETRGNVGKAGHIRDFGPRRCVVFDLPDKTLAGQIFAMRQIGVRYDWKGVLGWLFKANDRRRFYCFEYVIGAILQAMQLDIGVPAAPTGDTVQAYLRGIPVVYDGPAVKYRT